MSEIQLFKSGNIAIPAHLKGQLDDTTKSLMGGGNSKRISIKGGVFRMMVGGKEVAQNTDRSMNVIIVRAAEFNSRNYYAEKYDANSDKAVAPTCYSDDSVIPHPSAKTPQSDKCATCPQNIKGSNDNGEGRACRYSRRLAVVLENDPGGDVYGISLPGQSIFSNEPKKMGLQQYAKFLGGHGINVNAVVTELRFDTDVATPKLMFSANRPLTEGEYATVLEQRETPAALEAVTMTVAQLDTPATKQEVSPTPPPAVAAPAPAPAPAPVAQKAASKPVPKQSGFQVVKEEPAVEEPTLRPSTKPAAANVQSILADWADDADD